MFFSLSSFRFSSPLQPKCTDTAKAIAPHIAPTIDPISDPTANPPLLPAALLYVAAGAVPEPALGVGGEVVDPGEVDCVTVTAAADAVIAGWRSDTAAVLTPPTVCASVCSNMKRAP